MLQDDVGGDFSATDALDEDDFSWDPEGHRGFCNMCNEKEASRNLLLKTDEYGEDCTMIHEIHRMPEEH
ncbi:hypothetical protein NDU88_002231 [Pleurodeles waltl]|uniref:Uncharacterized protein n=1 Tax=Pleurodeles waltl TaxID=8319 RepID=A0AAV7TM01_PLEWA|nr:hypothetical protein NDU88_002231 [Pleurodeles waltl]